VIFTHQNLTSNWLTYLVHAKSTGELISFGFSDRSVRSLVSAKRSANRWVQTKKRHHFLADLWSQSQFRTQQNAERKTNPKSEVYRFRGKARYRSKIAIFHTHGNRLRIFPRSFLHNGARWLGYIKCGAKILRKSRVECINVTDDRRNCDDNSWTYQISVVKIRAHIQIWGC